MTSRDEGIGRRELLRRAGIGASFLALPSILAACGSDDDSTDAPEPTGSAGSVAPPGTDAPGTTAPSSTPSGSELDALLDSITSTEVIIGTYGGTTEEARRAAFWDPFTERTGVEVVVVDIPGTLGNEMAAGKVPVEWDAFHSAPDEYLTAKLANPDAEFPQVPEIAYEDLVPVEFQPYQWQSFTFAFVPAMLTGTFEGDQPQTWADFFDTEKFPGKRAWPGSTYTNAVFEVALMADGVPLDEIYPLDYERAKAKLRTIWDDMVFYDSYPAVQQLLSSEAAVLGAAPNGLWAGLQGQGVDVTVIWSATPVTFLNGELTIPGAPNLDAVQALAAFCNDPERQAQFAIATNYGPPSTKAFDFMTEEQAANLPGAPGQTVLQNDVLFNAENIGTMADEYLSLFA